MKKAKRNKTNKTNSGEKEVSFSKMAFFRQQLEAMKRLGGELILQEG
jgi:hypothetical protein